MSKKSNVHPDHYKTAGREPPGQGTVPEINKQNFGVRATEEYEGKGPKARRVPKKSPIKPTAAGKKAVE